MKKMVKYILLGMAILLLSGCGNNKSYKEISYQDVLIKMENKETFVLYIGSSECSACEKFSPVLKRVIKEYQLDVQYIDMAKLSEAEANKFATVINFGNSTPKVYFVKDGEYSQYNAIKGAQDYDTVVSKFKKNGYIKE